MRFLAKLLQQRAERFHQPRAAIQKLRAVDAGQPHERTLTLRSQPDSYLAPVAIAAYALYQSALHQPVGQTHRAVMPDQQVLGDFSYRGAAGTGKRPNCQQELMLLRLEPLGMRFRLAEMKKAADLKAEVGEGLIIRIA